MMKQAIWVMTMLLLAAPALAGGPQVFRDDFNGDFIGEQWEVVNPDPDSAIVQEGMLQIVTQVPEKKLFNAKNMLLYKGDLPKEYEVEARVLMTEKEWCEKWWKSPFVGLILKQDDDNGMVLVAGGTDGCTKSDVVKFARVKDGKWEPDFSAGLGEQQPDRPVRLKLVRKGRVFIGYYLARDKQGKPVWRRVGMFPLIKAGGYRVGLIAARGGNTHEQLDKVDWVEIRKLR